MRPAPTGREDDLGAGATHPLIASPEHPHPRRRRGEDHPVAEGLPRPRGLAVPELLSEHALDKLRLGDCMFAEFVAALEHAEVIEPTTGSFLAAPVPPVAVPLTAGIPCFGDRRLMGW